MKTLIRQNVAPYLDLHCLPMYQKWDASLILVKYNDKSAVSKDQSLPFRVMMFLLSSEMSLYLPLLMSDITMVEVSLPPRTVGNSMILV